MPATYGKYPDIDYVVDMILSSWEKIPEGGRVLGFLDSPNNICEFLRVCKGCHKPGIEGYCASCYDSIMADSIGVDPSDLDVQDNEYYDPPPD